VKSVSICLGFLLSLAGLLLFSPPTGAKDGGGNPFKHLVDIGGGRHLNMVCAGKGLPTIVFMQGRRRAETKARPDARIAAGERASAYDGYRARATMRPVGVAINPPMLHWIRPNSISRARWRASICRFGV